MINYPTASVIRCPVKGPTVIVIKCYNERPCGSSGDPQQKHLTQGDRKECIVEELVETIYSGDTIKEYHSATASTALDTRQRVACILGACIPAKEEEK